MPHMFGTYKPWLVYDASSIISFKKKFHILNYYNLLNEDQILG